MSIQDIKPDTSLYTDAVDKLRAMAAVLEAKRAGDVIEWKTGSGVGVGWVQAGPTEPDYSSSVLLEWRIAPPKPREVFVAFTGVGVVATVHKSAVAAADNADRIGGTYAKFVEVLP
jgi:hypothetical protein